jgi:hypothetical protein
VAEDDEGGGGSLPSIGNLDEYPSSNQVLKFFRGTVNLLIYILHYNADKKIIAQWEYCCEGYCIDAIPSTAICRVSRNTNGTINTSKGLAFPLL